MFEKCSFQHTNVEMKFTQSIYDAKRKVWKRYFNLIEIHIFARYWANSSLNAFIGNSLHLLLRVWPAVGTKRMFSIVIPCMHKHIWSMFSRWSCMLNKILGKMHSKYSLHLIVWNFFPGSCLSNIKTSWTSDGCKQYLHHQNRSICNKSNGKFQESP